MSSVAFEKLGEVYPEIINLMPDKFAGKAVFRIVVGTAFLFSIPDFLKFLIPAENLNMIYKIIPFSENGLGWVLPSVLTFLIVNAVIASASNGRDKLPLKEK